MEIRKKYIKTILLLSNTAKILINVINIFSLMLKFKRNIIYAYANRIGNHFALGKILLEYLKKILFNTFKTYFIHPYDFIQIVMKHMFENKNESIEVF